MLIDVDDVSYDPERDNWITVSSDKLVDCKGFSNGMYRMNIVR